MAVRDQFTDAELEAIRAATQLAEKETGGELVCVIVNRSDTYIAPLWQAAALGSVGAATLAGLIPTATEVWLSNPLVWIVLPSLAGAAIGASLTLLLPSLRRWLVPAAVMSRRVDRRAAAAFLEEEIFDTRDRTGVLLFVTLFEHQIRVLTDRGVERRIPAERWQPMIDRLIAGLRRRRPAEAIVEAIESCGALLVEHGVGRRADDRNELANRPRLRDE